MRVYRLSLEALDALQETLDVVNSERRGDVTVRIAIDDGLKIKLDEAGWTRPYDLTDESRPRTNLRRYRVVYSTDSPGSFLNFSAEDDETAIAHAQEFAYGSRIVSLTEGLVDGPRRVVELP